MSHAFLGEPEFVQEYAKSGDTPLVDGAQREFHCQHQEEDRSTSVSDPHEVEGRPESF